MRQRIPFLLVGICIISLLLAGCDTTAAGGTTATAVSPTGTTTSGGGQGSIEAANYCTSKGGEVVTRRPAYGTNGANPLMLAGSLQFCQFAGQDQTMIAISEDTLYTDQPTMAVLAYLAKPPVEATTGGANPATAYCRKLGGTDEFGGESDGGGGGWLSDDKNDPFYVLQTCIFPDLSAIDAWGLTYHAQDVIRGTDLSKVIRYQQPAEQKPGIFGR